MNSKYKGLIRLKSTDKEYWVHFDKIPDGTERFWAFDELDRAGVKTIWFAVDDISYFEYRPAK